MVELSLAQTVGVAAGRNWFPLVEISMQGLSNAATLWGSVEALAEGRITIIALVTGLSIIFAPALQIILLGWVLYYARSGRIAPGFRTRMRALEHLRPWSMLEVCLLGILIAIIATATPSAATDRYFHNFTAASPGGEFELEARSAANDASPRGVVPFAGDFQLTLRRTVDRTVIWTDSRPEFAQLIGGHVSESGWVVLWDGRDELIAVAPAGGETVGRLSIRDAVPESERLKYTFDSTAGWHWSWLSHWYFIEIENSPHFVLRTYWGRRLLMNLERGEDVAIAPDTAKLLDTAERGLVLSILATAVNEEWPMGLGQPHRTLWRTAQSNRDRAAAAAHLAGILKVHDAAPLLEAIEGSDSSARVEDPPPGVWPDRTGLQELPVTRAAQLSLRRLGAPLRGAAPMDAAWWDRMNGENTVRYFRISPGRTEAALNSIHPGISLDDVLRTIGPPDYRTRMEWQYDLEGDECTLVISHARDGEKVGGVRRAPAAWLDGDERDLDLAGVRRRLE